MDLLICGTAAAEAWPALFCTCEACARARELGGKNLRSRSAYMLGDRVRIDFGPDSNLHQQKYGLDYAKLNHLLVTHSHDDHWFPTDLGYRRQGFSRVRPEPLNVWGNSKVEARFTAVNGEDWSRYLIEFHRIEPWRPIDLGDGLTATPIIAAHDQTEECVNYLVETVNRAALIGHDTGWYGEATWEFLSGKQLNVLILDCTYGSTDHDRGHLGCVNVVLARDEMANRGAIRPDCRVVATHFSHNGGWLHDELETFFAPHGIEVAWDGMRLEI